MLSSRLQVSPWSLQLLRVSWRHRRFTARCQQAARRCRRGRCPSHACTGTICALWAAVMTFPCQLCLPLRPAAGRWRRWRTCRRGAPLSRLVVRSSAGAVACHGPAQMQGCSCTNREAPLVQRCIGCLFEQLRAHPAFLHLLAVRRVARSQLRSPQPHSAARPYLDCTSAPWLSHSFADFCARPHSLSA